MRIVRTLVHFKASRRQGGSTANSQEQYLEPSYEEFERTVQLNEARQKELNKRCVPNSPKRGIAEFASCVSTFLTTAAERGVSKPRIEAIREKFKRLEREAKRGAGGRAPAVGEFKAEASAPSRRSAIVRRGGPRWGRARGPRSEASSPS
jgi:hypothetical protein